MAPYWVQRDGRGRAHALTRHDGWGRKPACGLHLGFGNLTPAHPTDDRRCRSCLKIVGAL